MGSLDILLERMNREDVRRAIRIGACNVYHMCAHNLVHEKSTEILKGLYKSAAFTLQAIAFFQTKRYEKEKIALRSRLQPEDRRILETGMALKAKEPLLNEDLASLSALLLNWASRQILQYKEK